MKKMTMSACVGVALIVSLAVVLTLYSHDSSLAGIDLTPKQAQKLAWVQAEASAIWAENPDAKITVVINGETRLLTSENGVRGEFGVNALSVHWLRYVSFLQKSIGTLVVKQVESVSIQINRELLMVANTLSMAALGTELVRPCNHSC